MMSSVKAPVAASVLIKPAWIGLYLTLKRAGDVFKNGGTNCLNVSVKGPILPASTFQFKEEA
jgi:hypothetical protein